MIPKRSSIPARHMFAPNASFTLKIVEGQQGMYNSNVADLLKAFDKRR